MGMEEGEEVETTRQVGSTAGSVLLERLAAKPWTTGGFVEQALTGVKLKWRAEERVWKAGGYSGLRPGDSQELALMESELVIRPATEEEEEAGPPLGAFSVPKHSGGRRMILDARPINARIWPMGRTAMPSLKALEAEPVRLTEAFCVDVSKAYWSLPMSKDDQPALSFLWESRRMVMLRLAMGLQPAAGIFQRLMETILTPLIWKFPGLRLMIFQDDVGCFRTETMAEEDWREAKGMLVSLLRHAGLRIAGRKTQEGKQVVHLGFVVDLEKAELRMEPGKLQEMARMIGAAERCGRLTAGKAMSLLGKLGAGALVHPLVHLALAGAKRLVWGCWKARGKRANIAGSHQLLRLARLELKNLEEGRMRIGATARATGVEMQTDASKTGGGFVWWTTPDTGSVRRGADAWVWSREESGLPIAVLEALASLRALMSVSWTGIQEGKRKLRLWTDNRVLVSALRRWHGGGPRMAPVLAAAFTTLETQLPIIQQSFCSLPHTL